MEVQDGFIVGIFNYCDRWCEQCPLTNRCRVFATQAEMEFEEGNGPLTEPRIVRERQRLASRVAEMHAQLEEAGEAALPKPGECIGQLPPDMEVCVDPDPEVITHTPELRRKFRQLEMSANPRVRLAIETIKYFSLFVPVKMARALSQVAANGPGDQQSDANGSGKAALLALDRMDSAWRSLIDNHHVSTSVAAPFLAEIARMQRNINRALPDASRFIRPGFDELDEVRMLDAARC